MKVFIVGGRGNIGQEVALGLIRQEEIEKIILGDIDIDPAGLRVRLRKNQKISLVQIDANDQKALAGMLKDAYVAVNCADPSTRRPGPGRPWRPGSITLMFAMTTRLSKPSLPPISTGPPRKLV